MLFYTILQLCQEKNAKCVFLLKKGDDAEEIFTWLASAVPAPGKVEKPHSTVWSKTVNLPQMGRGIGTGNCAMRCATAGKIC